MLKCELSPYNIHKLFTFLLTADFSGFYISISGLIYLLIKLWISLLSRSVDKFDYHDCYLFSSSKHNPVLVIQRRDFVFFHFLFLYSKNKKLAVRIIIFNCCLDCFLLTYLSFIWTGLFFG